MSLLFPKGTDVIVTLKSGERHDGILMEDYRVRVDDKICLCLHECPEPDGPAYASFKAGDVASIGCPIPSPGNKECSQ